MFAAARRFRSQTGASSRRVEAVGVLLILILAPIATLAQDRDVIVLEGSDNSYRVSDQITDPEERKAFLALYDKKGPKEIARRAQEFLSSYPQSWLLAEVYEIASKAFMDLGEYDRTLLFGRQSLNLYPENPILLVPLANVEVVQGHTEEAEQTARDALMWLDRIGRYGSVPASKWPSVELQLRAASEFVLGRVAASRAFAASREGERRKLLREAEEHLSRARATNAGDPLSAYLMGIVKLQLGQPDAAAEAFAVAYRDGGPMSQKSQDHLQALYEASPRAAAFDSYVKELLERQRSQSPPKPPEESPPLPAYAGSAACQPCHTDIHEQWLHTGMAKMFRPYRPENIIGDFEHDNEFYLGDEYRWVGGRLEVIPGNRRTIFARMVIRRGGHYFELQQSNGAWKRYPVDYTIGSKWQQGYATRLPNGQVHVLPIEYNKLWKRWVNFWQMMDPPNSKRANLQLWETFSPWTSYQANCAACHTSQLRNVKGGGFSPDDLEFKEPGVNCETCHGPSARHVASRLASELYQKRPIDPPVDFKKISASQSVAICAQCHMQSALRQPGPKGELNYSRHGSFYPRFRSRPYVEFSIKSRYKDGRFRDTSFLVEALVRTACFQKGGATCVSCHDVHASDAADNPESLKFRNSPDQMCLQCHTGMAEKIEAHTHHPAESKGSRCVSCHMPPIVNSLMFEARSHEISSIPNAGMTLRFGQGDSPSACLLCHQDKTPQWLEQRMVARAAKPS